MPPGGRSVASQHARVEFSGVEQTRRLGKEAKFACVYGEGYLQGGGDVPARIKYPTAYHRNLLEAEAYTARSRPNFAPTSNHATR